LSIRDFFSFKDTHQLKVKGEKRYFTEMVTKKRARVVKFKSHTKKT
jgi:hypothetical protein